MKTFYTLLFIAILAPAALGAKLHQMDRFIEEETFFVARLVPDENIAKFYDLAAKLVPGDETEIQKEIKQTQKLAVGIMKDLRNSGLREAYVMMTLSGGLNKKEFFYFVFHTKPDFDDAKFIDLLQKGIPEIRKLEVKRIDKEYLFVGSKNILQRLETQEPIIHPKLWNAFNSIDASLVKAVLIPSDSSRRVIGEMVPTLPKILGGVPSSVLTDGIQTAAFGLSVKPETALEVKIQSKDAKAAQTFHEWSVNQFKYLAQMVVKEKKLPDTTEFLEKIMTIYQPTLDGDQVRFELKESTGQIDSLINVIRPPLLEARNAAQRTMTMSQLKQFGLAMHNYESCRGILPAAIHRNKEGKPLLSWRVHVLPFVEQQALYDQFKLDEPWDSPHNKKLIAKMPPIFKCPASKRTEPGMTNFVVITGPNTMFPEDRAITIKEVKDGLSNTIMVGTVNDEAAVIWTKPDDLKLDPEHPKKPLRGLWMKPIFLCTIGDGSVHAIGLDTISDEKLLKMFRRNDEKNEK